MSKIGYKELSQTLIDKYGLERNAAEQFVEKMFDVLVKAIETDRQVKVKGLGTFKVVPVAPRKSVDVNTGEPIIIEGRDKVTFTPDNAMRDLVNRPFSQFDTVAVNDGVDFTSIDEHFANPEAAMEPFVVNEPTKPDEPNMPNEPTEPNMPNEPNEPTEPNEPAIPTPSPQPTTTEEQADEAQVMSPATETERAADEARNQVIVMQQEMTRQHRFTRWFMCMSIVLLLACCGGIFYLFMQLSQRDRRIEHLEAEAILNARTPRGQALLETSVDTAAVAQARADSDMAAQKLQQQEKARIQQTEPAADRQSQPTQPQGGGNAARPTAKETLSRQRQETYDKDVRVRTGAYDIVGIARTVVAKDGQTIASISRTYLGPGMECYIEAVNAGRTQVKVGDKVNIPQLKLKKKK